MLFTVIILGTAVIIACNKQAERNLITTIQQLKAILKRRLNFRTE